MGSPFFLIDVFVAIVVVVVGGGGGFFFHFYDGMMRCSKVIRFEKINDQLSRQADYFERLNLDF